MDRDREQARIEHAYERARALPPSERPAFLEATHIDPGVRGEIESLLENAEEAEGMFDALLEAESRVDYGRALSREVRVGDYRILERLGAGGMGTVFLAQRTVLGVEQRVAIKIVRPGHVDPNLEARLLEEGRVLARLDHPSIARFVDGGLTADGLPYFAMEYVEGTPLLDYCAQEGLTVDARVRLFLDVCEAVQCAHQQLVVHRDLKPAHIIVEGDARIRLLDFGVAKILDRDQAGARRTGITDLWVTPSHASPEQIRGEPIGTSSDQYALGVILYELLTGVPPYHLAGRTASEIERIVCEEAAPPPSQVVSGKLSRRLAGDLDNIVLKAMAKEPRRRYETVAALADDLRNHLAARPVRARPDTWRYRASRYMRRNRTAVAAAAVAFLSLAAGAAVATWQAAVATMERDRAQAALLVSEQVRTFVTDLFWDDRTAYDRGIQAPRELLRRALVQAQNPELEPAVRAELLDVLGFAHLNMSEFATSERLLGQAVDLRRQLHPEGHPELASTLSRLSAAQRRLGLLRESERTAQEALAMQERFLGPDHPDVAETLLRLGRSLALQHGPQKAVDLHRRALDINRRALAPADPAVVGSMQTLAGSLEAVGSWQEAEGLYREALALQERSADDRALVGNAALTLGGFLAARGRVAEAEALHVRALGIHEDAYEAFDPRLAWPLASLGSLLVDRGEYDRGLELLRRALDIERRNWGEDHLSTAATMASLASALRLTGRYREAESLYWEVVAIERSTLGPHHPQTAGRLIDIGRLRLRMGDLDGAEAPLLEGLEIRRRGGGAGLTRAVQRVAELYEQRGQYERAEALLQEGLAVADTLPPDHSAPARTELLQRSIALYSAWGRPDEVQRVRALLASLDGSSTAR